MKEFHKIAKHKYIVMSGARNHTIGNHIYALQLSTDQLRLKKRNI